MPRFQQPEALCERLAIQSPHKGAVAVALVTYVSSHHQPHAAGDDDGGRRRDAAEDEGTHVASGKCRQFGEGRHDEHSSQRKQQARSGRHHVGVMDRPVEISVCIAPAQRSPIFEATLSGVGCRSGAADADDPPGPPRSGRITGREPAVREKTLGAARPRDFRSCRWRRRQQSRTASR